MKKITITNTKKGFTLLETLVAVFILTLALTGPIYIATLAIRSSVESRDNISAYYLAEEAIEVLRNKRDEISLGTNVDSNNWTNNITNGIVCSNKKSESTFTTCIMTRSDVGVYTFAQCGSGCSPLTFNPDGSVIYGSNTGSTNSKFTREIYLQTAAQDDSSDASPQSEVDVVVTIKWKDRGRDKEYRLIERLHNQSYSKYYE